MKALSPVLPGFEIPELLLGKDQPQYQPLPAIRTAEGLVLTRWEIENPELDKLLSGDASLFLQSWLPICHICGTPPLFPPVLPQVTSAQEIIAQAANQYRDAISPQLDLQEEEAKADPAKPATDTEIGELFRQIWTKQIGQAGYRERSWRTLRLLLASRGIKV